jgi:hypothetical protein
VHALFPGLTRGAVWGLQSYLVGPALLPAWLLQAESAGVPSVRLDELPGAHMAAAAQREALYQARVLLSLSLLCAVRAVLCAACAVLWSVLCSLCLCCVLQRAKPPGQAATHALTPAKRPWLCAAGHHGARAASSSRCSAAHCPAPAHPCSGLAPCPRWPTSQGGQWSPRPRGPPPRPLPPMRFGVEGSLLHSCPAGAAELCLLMLA